MDHYNFTTTGELTYDLSVAIGRGKINGAEPFGAYGRKTTIGPVTNELIWANGAWSLPAATGEQLRIVGDSAEDGPAGTGIRSLHLHYLDAALQPATEIIALNGLTPVLTVATNIRFVQCSHMETFGSTKAAVGSIFFTNIAATKDYNHIEAGSVRCSSSLRMVPAGKRVFLAGASVSSISGSSLSRTQVSLCTSTFYGHDYTAEEVLIPIGTVGVQDSSQSYTFPVPLMAPEGTLIGMLCTTDKAATITGDWFGWLEDAS